MVPELEIHWWIKQPKPMWSLPTKVCPQSNSLSPLPLLYTRLPFQKHTAPPLITPIPQNASSACIPEGRLPVCSSVAESWAHAFHTEPRALGVPHPVLSCAQIRGPPSIFRMSVWMPGGQLFSIRALCMQGYRESAHVSKIKIFHDAVIVWMCAQRYTRGYS